MEFKRMALETPVLEVEDPEIESMRQHLANQAKTVLNYGLFADRLQEKSEKKKTDSLVLALVELEIKPLVQKEVDEYQISQRALKNKEAFSDLPWYAKLVELWEKMIERLVGPINNTNANRKCAEFLFSAIIGAIIEIYALVTQNWLLAVIVSPFAFLLVSFFVVWILSVILIKNNITIKEWEWKSMTFTECEKQKIEIPEFAIDTAIRVKECIPATQLSVEILMNTERLLGDPFLVVQHGGLKYYIEVWDESKFEGRRIV